MTSFGVFQFLLVGTTLLQLLQLASGEFNTSQYLVAEGFYVFDRKSLDIYMREEGNDLDKAKASLLEDFNFFLTEANVYLDSLKTFGLDIDLATAGIQILDEDLHDKRSIQKGDKIEKRRALFDFESFLRRGKPDLWVWEYDFAVLMTGYDLVADDSILGVAWISKMCDDAWAHAIVQVTGLMSSSVTFVHEVAHILGSGHDPDDAPEIMAPAAIITYSERKYTFSELSATSIKDYLKQDGKADCLLETSDTSVIPNVTPDSYTGKLQDVSTICERSVGYGSHISVVETLAQDNFSPDGLCSYVLCRKPWDPKSCRYELTTEGMPCGLDKACLRGKCVYNKKPSTENVDSNCLWGNDPTPQTVKGGSCAAIMTTGIGSQNCLKRNTSNECCASCEKYKTNMPDCRYGDVVSMRVNSQETTCSSLVSLYGIKAVCKKAQLQEPCCDTCSRYLGLYREPAVAPPTLPSTTPAHPTRSSPLPADCPNGDVDQFVKDGQTMSCYQVVAMYGPRNVCKRGDIRDKCCDTCTDLQKLRSIPDCLYGDVSQININGNLVTCPDMVDIYGENMCQRRELNSPCCRTCAKYK